MGVFRLAVQEKGITLDKRLPLDLPPAAADIGLIQRGLKSVIENAIKHTDPGWEPRQ